MKVENLETAEHFAKKRRELKTMFDLLSNYVNAAEVKVVVKGFEKPKEATIKEDTFNALMCKLIESEIENIDRFVEGL